MRALLAGTVGIGLIFPVLSASAQEPQLTRVTRTGHEVGIGHATRWNRDCKSMRPKLTLTRPPDHGSICARAITVTTRRNAVSDDQTCVGKRMRALQVIYQPQNGFSGSDYVDYVIEFPQMQKRIPIHVDIEIRPDPAGSNSKLNTEIAPGKAGDVIIECAPLMS